MAQNPVEEDSSTSGTTVSAENKRWFIQAKKAALREVSDNTNPAEIPLRTKDGVTTSDHPANKMAGTKRPNPSSPASPLPYTYVRRKPDTEQGKANGSPILKNESFKEKIMQTIQQPQELQNLSDSQHFLNIYNEDVTKAAELQNGFKLQNGSPEEVTKDTKSRNEELGEVNSEQNGYKGETREAMKLRNGTMGEASEASKSVSSSLTASRDWRERFIQLQAFLKNCDQSNLEDYKKMLRSSTAAGRSKHAVELEKRAIHLLLEEGKELYRMKILNVLGKGSASDPSLYLPYQPSPLAQLHSRGENVPNIGERTLKKVQKVKPVILPEGTTIAETCRRVAARRVDSALITDPSGLLTGILTAEIRLDDSGTFQWWKAER